MNSIKIIAIVKFNDGEAFVLDRDPVFLYERKEKFLIAEDFPFFSVYVYDPPGSGFQAFAGREFYLNMKDGTKTHCKGQWWDGGSDFIRKHFQINLNHVTYNTIKDLKRCYVYYGGLMEQNSLIKLREKYNGCIYPYHEYKKLLNYDDIWKQYFYQERAKKNVIKNVKRLSKELKILKK